MAQAQSRAAAPQPGAAAPFSPLEMSFGLDKSLGGNPRVVMGYYDPNANSKAFVDHHLRMKLTF